VKLDSIKSVILPRDQKSRTQLYIFLICLAFSVFIWLIIKLSEENITEITYEIELVQVPEGKIVVSGENQVIKIGYKEKLSDIFSLQFLKSREPVRVSMANVPVKQIGRRYQAVVFPAHLADYISRQQEFNFQIVSISPDTLTYILEDLKSKRVPVTANIDAVPGERHMIYGDISLIPDSITIEGPESVVGKVEEVAIQETSVKELRDTTKLKRPILPFGESDQLSYEPDEIEVVIPVEEFTEAEVVVPVTVRSSLNRNVKTFPEQVQVICRVALSDYPKIDKTLFTVTADIDSARQHNVTRVKLQLGDKPAFVRNVRINPDKVEYIIIDM
jgi:hypothetical protein